MFKILVVCTANVCRSPAGQQFLRQRLAGRDVVIDSAGTLALDGNAADATIREMMIERGHPEIEAHRSRALMPSHLSQYDLVLCMERDHVERVQRLSPYASNKTRLFGQWQGQADVEDPIGRSSATYARSLDIMDGMADQWVEKMLMMGMVK